MALLGWTWIGRWLAINPGVGCLAWFGDRVDAIDNAAMGCLGNGRHGMLGDVLTGLAQQPVRYLQLTPQNIRI